MRRLRYAVLIALLIGCAGGGSFWVMVEFPAGYQDEAATLEVYAIEPGAGASCGALEEGAALPGDPDYQIEDTVSMTLPVAAGARQLDGIGPGDRFFYAQAKDAQGLVILAGCTAAHAGGSGVQEVLIKLDWTCRVSNGAVEICDGVDNNCDGSTDEGDPVLICADVSNAVATACTAGQCVYECSEGWGNANGEWSDGCECQITRNGFEWCDGLDNDCDGETDPAGCRQCSTDAECTDPGGCMQGVCNAGVCETGPVPNGTGCDDSNLCTDPDTCTDGICGGSPTDCSHLDADCTQGACNPADGTCQAQPINEGVGCNDGLYCNVGETCSSGACTGGTALDCSGSGDQCRDGACNETDDVCEGQPKTDGTSCDDQDACSSLDTCQSGVCTAGATDKDTDGDTYFDDQCPNGDDCNDGDQTVNPGETEGPDGDPTCSDNKDNDCDGLTDAGDGDCVAAPAVHIFRSVGPGNNSPVAWGAGNTVGISGSSASFSSPLPPDVGVGDAISYDTDHDSSVDAIAFIHQRISSSEYIVKDADGNPPAEVTVDGDWEIYRAYTSLYNAERGTENFGIDGTLRNFDTWSGGKDLVASNQVWNIACYGDDADTDDVNVSGWTTGPNNYIRIFTPTSSSEVGVTQRHDGKWNFSKYFIYINGDTFVDIAEPYTEIEGLQIAADDTGTSSAEIVTLDAAGVKLSHCLIVQTGGSNTTAGIQTTSSADNVMIFNTIIFDINDFGINADGSVFVYNVTVADCGDDAVQAEGNGVLTVKNTLVTSSGDTDFDVDDLGNLTCYNCASSDDTANDFGGSGNRVNQTFSFVDRFNGDYHLTSGDTGAKDRGLDLSADPDLAFSDDIDGQIRPEGAAWDIGADESGGGGFTGQIYRSVGPGSTSPLATGSGNLLSISGSNATFASPLPNNIGVGDVIQYDTNGDNSINAVAFIYSRISSTDYMVKNASGAQPTAVGADTDWSVYRAYTSLYNAERGRENSGLDSAVQSFETWSDGRDLVSSGETWNIACYADGVDTSGVNIGGWTTGPSNYIRIFTPTAPDEVGTSQRHPGNWSYGRYVLEATGEAALSIFERYTQVEGLQLGVDTSTTAWTGVVIIDAADVDLSHCLVTQTGGPADIDGISISASATDTRVWNSVVSDVSCDCIWSEGGNAFIYNVTVAGCGCAGLDAGNGLFVAKNVIAGWTSEDGFDRSTGGSLTCNYCASSDSSADDYGGTGNLINRSFGFVDPPGGDFHLTSGDTGARNQGTNLSSDPDLSFSDDIDGETRGGTWDIGADEY